MAMAATATAMAVLITTKKTTLALANGIGGRDWNDDRIQAYLFMMLGQSDTDEDDVANSDARHDGSGSSDGDDAAVRFLRVSNKSLQWY